MMQTDATAAPDEPIIAETTAVEGHETGDKPMPVPPKPKRSSFGGAVLGGLIAAIAGFGVAQIVPNGWPLAATQTLSAQLADQTVQIAALQDQLANLPKTQQTDPVVSDRLTALEGRKDFDPKPVESRLLALENSLTAMEKLPSAGSGATSAAVAALQADMQALRDAATKETQGAAIATEAQLKEAQAIAAETAKNADDLALSVRRLAALSQLQAALDSGAPFAAALVDLASVSDPVPAALAQFADKGLPTSDGLKAAFAPAARLSLDAALRANMGESWSERAASFLRSQTGARSLEPREGSDPDAVLSRAEAAVNAGDLKTAFDELQALPPEAQPAFADWRAMAETRLAAETAIAALAATIGK